MKIETGSNIKILNSVSGSVCKLVSRKTAKISKGAKVSVYGFAS